MSNVLSVSLIHGLRRGAAIAALCLAACGADPGMGPAGDPGPLPANPPATPETAQSLSLVLDELLPGWTVTTTRQKGSDAPQQETLAPAGALTLSGTASDVFSAMILPVLRVGASLGGKPRGHVGRRSGLLRGGRRAVESPTVELDRSRTEMMRSDEASSSILVRR